MEPGYWADGLRWTRYLLVLPNGRARLVRACPQGTGVEALWLLKLRCWLAPMPLADRRN